MMVLVEVVVAVTAVLVSLLMMTKIERDIK